MAGKSRIDDLIQKAVPNDNEFVLLTGGSKVEVSRRKKEEVQQQLKIR